MRKYLFIHLAAVILGLVTGVFAADLKVPKEAVAGTAITIGTAGEGNSTLYLIGPVTRFKRTVHLGDNVELTSQDVRAAGLYTAILRGNGETVAKTFFISPAQPAGISFLAQPSRVPAGVKDVISGTAFVADRYHNLALAPTPVKFELNVEGASPLTRIVESQNGVAWTRMTSSKHAGNAQFTASTGDVSVKRIVQEVAAEPCNLRFRAQRSRLPGAPGSPAPGQKEAILVETDPVRDCAGNPVPDGTIVTFTDIDPLGKSTVDAVVKKGIARADLPAAPQATISVASGVVSSNEIHWVARAE